MPDHRAVVQQLLHAYRKGRLGHALLLTGGGGFGAYDVAISLAQVLICPDATDASHSADCSICSRVRGFGHPDFLGIAPLPTLSERRRSGNTDGSDPVSEALAKDPYAPLAVGANWGITADQAREVIRWTSMTSWESPSKVVLIAEADRVTEPTGDILLKTLEEPPQDVTIILVTARPQDLLPTVRSRCHETRVPPLGAERIAELLTERGIGDDGPTTESLLARADGDFWRACALVGGDADQLRGAAADLIAVALDPARTSADVMVATRKATDNATSGQTSELVRWIVWWLRDLLLAQVERSDDAAMDKLAPMADRMGRERLGQWLEEADRAYEMLGRNITPPAVLATLMLFPRDQRFLGGVVAFPPLDLAVSG